MLLKKMCLVYGCDNKIVLLIIKIKKKMSYQLLRLKKKQKLIDGQDDSGFFKKENYLKDH